jgi:hypothetical protein
MLLVVHHVKPTVGGGIPGGVLDLCAGVENKLPCEKTNVDNLRKMGYPPLNEVVSKATCEYLMYL